MIKHEYIIALVCGLGTLGLLIATDTPANPQDLAVGDSFQDCETCPEMIITPAGSFKFGSSPTEPLRMALEEGPQYDVNVPFLAVGRTEVTEESWQACIEDSFCTSEKSIQKNMEGRSLPVSNISWQDITRENGYLSWLNSKVDGTNYRLPSEAEWEYYSRAGNQFAFPRKYEINSNEANFRGTEKYIGKPASDYRGKKIAVGSFVPNGFGLYDTQGNVLEWTADCWFETLVDYKQQAHPICERRGLRGGSWLDEPNSLRYAFRRGYPQDLRTHNIGFRVVKTIAQNNIRNVRKNESLSMQLSSNLSSDVTGLNQLGSRQCQQVEVKNSTVLFKGCKLR